MARAQMRPIRTQTQCDGTYFFDVDRSQHLVQRCARLLQKLPNLQRVFKLVKLLDLFQRLDELNNLPPGRRRVFEINLRNLIPQFGKVPALETTNQRHVACSESSHTTHTVRTTTIAC